MWCNTVPRSITSNHKRGGAGARHPAAVLPACAVLDESGASGAHADGRRRRKTPPVVLRGQARRGGLCAQDNPTQSEAPSEYSSNNFIRHPLCASKSSTYWSSPTRDSGSASVAGGASLSMPRLHVSILRTSARSSRADFISSSTFFCAHASDKRRGAPARALPQLVRLSSSRTAHLQVGAADLRRLPCLYAEWPGARRTAARRT